MIKNYFFLNRFVIEAGKIMPGMKIHSIFSQEKDKLIVEFGEEPMIEYLEINVNPGNAYINIRNRYSRAKKNTVELFNDLYNKTFRLISIATDDRIIRIKLDDSALYFTIRGKFTNVIYINDEGKIEAFKKTEEDILNSLSGEFSMKRYIEDFNILDLNLQAPGDYFFDIKKKFPILGNEIIKEAKRRYSDDEEPSRVLSEVLNSIKNEHPAVFIDEQNNEVHLAVESFGVFSHQKKEVFDNLISATGYYLTKKHFLKERSSRLKLIHKHLERELNKLSNKINNLRGRLAKGSKQTEYKNLADLLLINLGKIKPGMTEIVLADIYDNTKQLKIKLDKKLSPQKNAGAYFEKSKAEKINYEKSKQLLNDAELQYRSLKKLNETINDIDDIKKLNSIMKQLKIKGKNVIKTEEDLKIKFKHYVIDGKYNVYVGRDSKNNDLLTTRFAKQNDYWFHARSVSGSHVVLRVDNTKEPVPKSVLKKAAALAAYHSKAKTAGLVPVSYTLKKYVVKKKSMPAGAVHLLREDVLLVRPGIPKDCEFIIDE